MLALTSQYFRYDLYVPEKKNQVSRESQMFKKICGQLEIEDLALFLGFEIYPLKI